MSKGVFPVTYVDVLRMTLVVQSKAGCPIEDWLLKWRNVTKIPYWVEPASAKYAKKGLLFRCKNSGLNA